MAGVQSMTTTESLDCVFRAEVRGANAAESAQCLLLAQILDLSPEQATVTRRMCEICVEQTRDRTFSEHPIFPSLVYQRAAEQLIAGEGIHSQAHWNAWLARAEAALLQQAIPSIKTGQALLCDVILCTDQDTPQCRAAIESVLNQSESVPILHIIDSAPEPIDWGHHAARWNVQIHRLPGPVTPLCVVSQISSALRTPSLAIQSPCEISDPQRLARALRALRDSGAELFVAAVPRNQLPTDQEDSSHAGAVGIIPGSLVVRRATLVDLGLTAREGLETEADLISEVSRQGRLVVTGVAPVVSADDATAITPQFAQDSSALIRPPTPAFAPSLSTPQIERRHRFPLVPVRCDVVLPFRGHLHYVREALDGLLKQEQATLIIHLIDDATTDATTDFLDEWAAHPQLRVYRNRENIGQFQSFNNVAPYWETDLVAVQDADDISLPHRLHWAGQMLHWSGADYFGGAVELFGDDDLIRPVMSETKALERIRRADYRRSFYPQWAKTDYFLENPTAVFRTAMFREMGGYADFGSRLMNRTSLDTEFQLRCLFRGVRFAITREVVTRYRVHPESATQDRLTGWGTTPRAASIRQLEERCRLFRGGDFDPRSFGALGRYTGVTERWPVG